MYLKANKLLIMKKAIYAILIFVFAISSKAQNPIVPQGVYIADPSAHVWQDGKMYVYGSRDESKKYYCSKSYRVVSSNDLITWDLSDTSFSSIGPNDGVPYSDNLLFAPDAQFFDGSYYLYYCMPAWGGGDHSCEGVATSDSPYGPFLNGKPIDIGKYNQIDPCVFIDDDGQAYYIWGQFSAKMAKLKSNRTEIDTASIVDNVVSEKDHFFHEGAYMIKRNGLYYMVYADVSRGGAPTCIAYSVSESPMGPFTYGGVIIDNKYSDPSAWNNHGSLVEFKDQWYVFYHRPTNNSEAMRKACIEPISFREDGSIPEVQMTSQGAGPPLDAFEEMDASRACMLLGNVRISTLEDNNEVLSNIYHNDKAFFKYLDFKNGADSVTLKVAPGSRSCVIDLSIDALTHSSFGATSSIGSIKIPEKGSKEWITVRAAVKPTTGIHALRLSISDPSVKGFNFSTDGDDKIKTEEIELCKIDAIQFK